MGHSRVNNLGSPLKGERCASSESVYICLALILCLGAESWEDFVLLWSLDLCFGVVELVRAKKTTAPYFLVITGPSKC